MTGITKRTIDLTRESLWSAREQGEFSRPVPTQYPEKRPMHGRHNEAHPDAIVYLIQEPSVPKHTGRVIDITPLIWWGQVRTLMERSQTASFQSQAAYIQIETRLRDFQPDRDYIAVAGGDSLAVLLAGAAIANLGHEYFFYLRFERTKLPNGQRDPASGAYVPVFSPINKSGIEKYMAGNLRHKPE